MFFFGEYRATLDDKGRMRIPTKLKLQLDRIDENGYIIYAGTMGCLSIMPMCEFEKKYLAPLEQSLISDVETQESYRFFSSTAQKPEEDSQGRFILMPKLKKIANIKKKVVFLGVMNRIEIWDEDAYEERYDTDKHDMLNVMRVIEKNGIQPHSGSVQ